MSERAGDKYVERVAGRKVKRSGAFFKGRGFNECPPLHPMSYCTKFPTILLAPAKWSSLPYSGCQGSADIILSAMLTNS